MPQRAESSIIILMYGQDRELEHKKPSIWLDWLALGVGIVVVLIAGLSIIMHSAEPNAEPEVGNTAEETEETPDTPDEPEAPAEETPTAEPPKEEAPAVEIPETKPAEPAAPQPAPAAPAPAASGGKKLIALTFDDGPSVYQTPRLLDTLKARNIKVTFFVLGNMAQKAPEIVRREEAEGHEVASHTPYHHQLTTLSAAQIQAEKAEMERIFTEILGHQPAFTRPPYGSVNALVRDTMAQPLILWSVDPRDWADRNATTVCNRVVSGARDGAIILVHDIHATTVDAVPCIIDSLRSQGYEFLTVSELAATRGVQLLNGYLYYSF